MDARGRSAIGALVAFRDFFWKTPRGRLSRFAWEGGFRSALARCEHLYPSEGARLDAPSALYARFLVDEDPPGFFSDGVPRAGNEALRTFTGATVGRYLDGTERKPAAREHGSARLSASLDACPATEASPGIADEYSFAFFYEDLRDFFNMRDCSFGSRVDR